MNGVSTTYVIHAVKQRKVNFEINQINVIIVISSENSSRDRVFKPNLGDRFSKCED